MRSELFAVPTANERNGVVVGTVSVVQRVTELEVVERIVGDWQRSRLERGYRIGGAKHIRSVQIVRTGAGMK